VALVASSRKVLARVYVLRDGRPYQPRPLMSES
jgi:hypothetical protein